MKSTVATQVTFSIPGVPPSPNRTRLTREDPEVLAWRDKTAFLARGARARAHWDVPTKVDPPAPRYVKIVLHRRHLLDPDHLVTSCTPVINGLKGALIYDDNETWCQLQRPWQIRIPADEPEHTLVLVSLVAPDA